MPRPTRFLARSITVAMLATCVLVHAASQTDTVTADGARYTGAKVEGKRHGHGRLEWPNKAIYEGEFLNGLMHGQGLLIDPSGERYEGSFKLGMMTGIGRSAMIDGSVYVGEYARDRFNGRGKLTRAEGGVYDGMFQDGYYHGHGKYSDGQQSYEGDFVLGQYDGSGVEIVKERGTYRGRFKHSRYNGKGRYESVDGDTFEGNFFDGEFTGAGTLKRKDGSTHVGRFIKWRSDGAGVYTDTSGRTFEGNFADGIPVGKIVLRGRNGMRYLGQSQNWLMHGEGELRTAEGDIYKGSFAHGLYDGQGTLTYAKPRPDGTTTESGIWRFGRLHGAEEDAKRQLEAALYNQRALLDTAIGGLAPRVTDKINMYQLLIAGDGSQEVFRREVEFVRDQFARQFGLNNRSIALINSRYTLEKAPMATLTSIGESLRAIAAKMDVDRDILFLFLTSHGSQDHEFSLTQNKMELRDLTAKALGEMVKKSGIRHKVVVISACYGGGFIDAIRDDTTLVITAARHDRKSFGCADENDFTDFGRAFFKDALPKSRSFQDAFHTAEKMIKEREEKDFVQAGKEKKYADGEYSFPQIVTTPTIDQHLRAWWAQLGR